MWVYWSANIVFFGAEFTQVYARTHGSMKAPVEDRRPRLSGQPGRLSSTGGIGASLMFVKSLKKLFT